MASPGRKHVKPNYVNSTSSFEYIPVGVGVHHLPPKQLLRIPFTGYRAGLMFLVTFLTAGTFAPLLPISIFYGYIDDPFGSSGVYKWGACRAPFNPGDSSRSDNVDMEGPLLYLTFILTWGNFSLATAKSIDIAWDLVVGRGGQALIALICYKVHLEGLIHVMESSSVSYELYTALVFSNTSLVTFIALVKQILSTRTYLARMLWLLFSTVYTILFPTLMAALTGYSSIKVCWIVLKDEGGFTRWDEFFDQAKQIAAANTSDRENYGDIPVYLYNGANYTYDYYNNRTTFSLVTDRYGYGVFPFITMVVMSLHCVWVYGTYGLWVDSNRKSQLSQAGRSVGTYRAVIDLGDVLAQDLGTTTCAYSEKQLREHLSKKNLGLKYYQSSNRSTQYIGLTSGNYGGRIDLDSSKGMLFGSKEAPLSEMEEV